jgi:hypothetical protein
MALKHSLLDIDDSMEGMGYMPFQHLPYRRVRLVCRSLIRKKMRVKLKKDIIVRGKPMNRCKITCVLWHMENIFKKNMSIRGRYSVMTNVLYRHTNVVCCMHLILTTIVLLHGQFVQISSDMNRGSTISIPH